MASRPYDCDRDRLRLSLDDRLSPAQQAELATHLEACPHCRGELERMAAASQYWNDAARLLGDSPTGVVAEEPGAGDQDGDRDAGWLHLLDPPDPDRPETLGRLGSYEVLEVLGRGGMGLVLKARDPGLDRTVAIKILNPGLAHGATARRRFDREARAIAAVGHEHIVAIHAVDVFRGLPYLVMQYVPGRSLQEKLDAAGPLEIREILRIGTQAARALAAAHAQGVVHRDIKPANILLENCVERVRLTDFGLARAVDDASLTHSGLIAGTPQYMAPEQARGEPVDARADLFALGAVLYAMAAGRPPFRADSAMAVLRRVCDDRHRPIRDLNPDVPGWLAATIDRLLAKDPDDRFQSAAEVADLLEKGLAHLQQPTILPPPAVPGEPDPPATAPRTRGPRRLAMAAAFVMAAILGIGATDAAGLTQVSEIVATILRIRTADGTLVIRSDDPDVKVRIDDDEVVIGGAGPQEVRVRAGQHRVQTIKDGKPGRETLVTIARGGKEIVNVEFEPADDAPPASPSRPGRWLRQAAPAAPPSPSASVPGGRRIPATPVPPVTPPAAGPSPKLPAETDRTAAGHVEAARARAMVWSLAYAPDGRHLAIAQQAIDRPESVLRVRDLSRRADQVWLHDNAGFRSVAFSTDGRSLAAGAFDGTLMAIEADGEWKLHHTENQGSAINAVTFLPGSRVFAVGDWDGWVRFHGPDVEANRRPIRYPGRIWSLAVGPDGQTLAVGGEARMIQVYDLPNRRLKATLQCHDQAVQSLDFSPDGKTLVSAGGRFVRFWDTATWKENAAAIPHTPEVICVKFSPDGQLLAISDGEAFLPHYKFLQTSVMLWDIRKHAEVRRLWGHTNTIWALAFSPDGKTLASGSADQTVKFWDVATGRLRETLVPGESDTGAGTDAPK